MTVIYEAVRDGVRVLGNMVDMVNLLGKKAKYIDKAMKRGYKVNGWDVRGLYRAEWEYTATHEEEDPIVGTLEEVACLTGFTQTYIWRLSQTGQKSRSGWRVKREYRFKEYRRRSRDEQ